MVKFSITWMNAVKNLLPQTEGHLIIITCRNEVMKWAASNYRHSFPVAVDHRKLRTIESLTICKVGGGRGAMEKACTVKATDKNAGGVIRTRAF